MLLVKKLTFQISDRTYVQNNQEIALDEGIEISYNPVKNSRCCKK
jgi:hypothetical protein